MKLGDDIRLIGIRLLAIMYIAVLYVMFGIYMTILLDEYGYHDIFLNNDDDPKDSVFQMVWELGVMVGIIACIAFIGRNLIQIIPFPFDGVFGFDYESVRELTSGAILFVFMITFSASVQQKVIKLQTKLNLIKTKKYKSVQT
jgi:hypothetical protein